MKCLVTTLVGEKVRLDINHRTTGEDVLKAVCHHLSICEVDYFGLLYELREDERLWLNARNGVIRQTSYWRPRELWLMVKFFVPPHELLQETTRHYFFLQASVEFSAGKLRCSSSTHERLVRALVAWANLKVDDEQQRREVAAALCLCKYPADAAAQTDGRKVAGVQRQEWSHLESVLGQLQTRTSREYCALQALSQLECYGTEQSKASMRVSKGDLWSASALVTVSLGDQDVAVYYSAYEGKQERIHYSVIRSVTIDSGTISLLVYDDDYRLTMRTVEFRMACEKASIAMYRSITERFSFYRCDTVRESLAGEYTPDLKTTILSYIFVNWELSKEFAFDIKRTKMEAQDMHARLALQGRASKGTIACANNPPLSSHDSAAELSASCCVCMDNVTSAVTRLFPCGHSTFCSSCADEVSICPLCRAVIVSRQAVDAPLPTSMTAAINVSADDALRDA